MRKNHIGEHDVRAASPEIAQERLIALRSLMAHEHIDAYLLPRSDEYQGEYVPSHAMRLAWLTGFTGSAGYAAVLIDDAAIFIDGRYTLQVTQQCDSDLYNFMDLSWVEIAHYMDSKLTPHQTIAYDPALWTQQQLDTIRSHMQQDIEWRATDQVMVDQIWIDAPAKPEGQPYPHALEYAGKSTADKLAEVWAALPEQIDALYIGKPEDICWTLNVRGDDVPCTPLVLSTLLLFRDGQMDWFIEESRITQALRQSLPDQLTLRSPGSLATTLSARHAEQSQSFTIATDFEQTNVADLTVLETAGVKLENRTNPTILLKALKNETEQEGARQAHETDGVALVKFLHWLETKALSEGADELAIEAQLQAFREESDTLKGISFESIVGSGPNGAIVHYRVTPKTSRQLQPDDIVLVDSGGQYFAGTTDVTRTVSLGKPTEEQRRRFTQVLKGHIQLSRAYFPIGTTGAHLDALARLPLWMDGKNYAHGTGHGVGSYLGVHEGPQSISIRGMSVPLQAGMICSNEPGYYENGAYGIRIENLVLVTESQYPEMLQFENLTLAPIQKTLIDTALLSDEEKQWLNRYHQTVWDKLYDQVTGDCRNWLAEATKPL